jgi:drug/metabolite transporter (DMT)-like permease
MSEPAEPPPKPVPNSQRILTIWFAMMATAGAAFGISAKDRPFGDDVLLHPVVIMFACVGAALLAIRFALRRPVTEVIPDRLLFAGCVVGLVAFLVGNWLAFHLRDL